MSEELKPCPFCGNEPKHQATLGVWCDNDGCSIVGTVFSGGAAHWNRRAAPQPAAATGDDREAFEAWARGRGRGHMLSRAGGHDDFYADPRAQAWWTVWQASAAHRREDQRDASSVLCITAAQLLDALELAAPDAIGVDIDRDHEQMETEMCIGRLGGSIADDGADTGPGLFAWYAEYPEEGVIPLKLDSEVRAEIEAIHRTAAPAHGEPGALEQGDAL